jgi:hypothetical protein
MIGRYACLAGHPQVFRSMTGLSVTEFDTVVADILPAYATQHIARLSRPVRRRAVGAGHPFGLRVRDQILLTVIWLRIYPTNEVLGYLLGVSDSTVSRVIHRVVPLLEQAGRDTMRMPDPGRKHRRELPDLLRETPQLAVIIDSFEQRVQRPKDRVEADWYYSGKKKAHTLKSQVAVDESTGEIVDVSVSVRGPMADLALLKASHLGERLPEGVGMIGDLAYVGMAQVHPHGLGAAPRRKPRGQPRPQEDIAYNTAFSRRRITVEHTIGRLRRYQAITQPDRHHRQHHTERVCSIAGLVNRRLRRCPIA